MTVSAANLRTTAIRFSRLSAATVVNSAILTINYNATLSAPLDGRAVGAIRQVLLDHVVVFFRGQNLTPATFREFAGRFGAPVEHPFVRGLPGFPEIIEVLKREDERSNFGGIWHSDTSYLEEPPMGSLLLARELPPYGGDTLFANQYLAFEALSEGLQRTLSGLRGVNTSAKADVTRTREDRVRDSGAAPRDYAAELRRSAPIPRRGAGPCT